MIWTEDHDILLCREILDVDPFTGTKKGMVQRGSKWTKIVDNLSEIDNPKFKVDVRAIRDRYNLLSQKFRKKLKEEEKKSGIETDMTEVENAIEEIIEKEDASEEVQEGESDAKRKAKDAERGTAEGMRKKAMERLGETQKRKGEDKEDGVRKRRSNGNDAIVYLEERNKSRKEEMELKKKEIELQEKKHADFMRLMLQQQQQQAKQAQDFQMMMMNVMTKMMNK